MPDERREIQLKRPASHSCSRRFIIYSTRAGRTQEGVYCAGTGNWDSHQTLCRMAAKKPSQGCTPGRVRRYCPRLSESMSLHTSSPVLQRCSSLALQSIKRHEESAVSARCTTFSFSSGSSEQVEYTSSPPVATCCIADCRI